ncbi:selenocysteine lyase isoform X2 [Lingula anatina]|nr:selenocysteine lyase isoform X2 [Lingula anatina]XP_013383386.1 selenocysteine lyase isoform X2 [Lingula anatina]|eukprot:XP_013383385.1 selenocysteine lyase isoform X2 [Lingula anatina]
MEHNISGPELQNDVEDMIYLDYNATTPLEDEVVETISRTLREAWQNPSSSYATDTSGKSVKQIIDEARQNVADMIGGNVQDIVFTSGGTESNNMVFHTMLSHFEFKYNKTALERQTEGHSISVPPDKNIPHFITSNIEHDSIKIVLQEYQTLRKAEVTFVPVSKDTGQIVPEDVIAAIKPNTVLVSVMLANNETGIIQPIAEISERLRTIKRGDGETSRIFLHTDAAQALGKIPVSVQDLRVDYLTIVGHKFYGPRIGALYFPGRAGTAPLYPMFYGGGQERNYRPGTENTPMIAGLGKAAELVSRNVKVYGDHMEKTRNYLETQLETTFPDRVKFNGRYPKVPRLPNTCNVSILGAKLHGFQVLSKLKYVQTSVGAACHAQNRPSHILLASGVDPTAAANALRLSVGRHTTKDDIDRAIVDLKQAVQALESDIGQ